ncbi:DUF6088 family protein [Bacillus toyonensis]|uniref:DUF6088 family protein n=1 Tax=Bacillus toyonensis TaxID=155322 RepID=UPI002E22E607|nr:DUF6088 family protein [Bacillus toyonensis]
MDLYTYLFEQYGYDEPIFLEYLLEDLDIKPNTLRQKLKRLTDTEKIARSVYRNGIYFIPSPDRLLQVKALSFNKIIKNKYLIKKGQRIGYITGLDFANALSLTTQVPSTIEIVTQKENTKNREVNFNQRIVILHKPKTLITEGNYKILQILELITKFRTLSDLSFEKAIPIMSNYLKNISISREELENYLKLYAAAKEPFIKSGLYKQLVS